MHQEIDQEITVIGGGIVGVAICYHLARRGVSRVSLIEAAEQLGSGSTAAAFGGIRQQFATAAEIELSRRGLEFWRSLGHRLARPCPYRQDGYLLVTANPERKKQLAQAAAQQLELGCGPVHILDRHDLQEVAPWLNTAELVGGTLTPHDGRVSTAEGLAAMHHAARSAGVITYTGNPVTSITRLHRRWRTTLKGGDEIHSIHVIVAAGTATSALLAPLGFNMPIDAVTWHSALTEPALSNIAVPITIDLDTGLLVEREGEGLLLSLLHACPPSGYTRDDMLYDLAHLIRARAPSLTNIGIRATLTGIGDMTPDGHPYAGQLTDGLWVLAGFSGHGIMHGPPLADILAAAIVDEHSVDELSPILDSFTPNRDPHRALAEGLIAARR